MKNYALITGASSGIGEQCAIQLSETHNLILCGRNTKAMDKVLEKCANNKNHIILTLDLGKIEEIESKLIEIIAAKGIVIDKFLHSAGAINLMGAKAFDYEAVKYLMDINVYSAMEIVKTLIRKKPNQKALKNVLFISALYSKKGVAGNSFYAATKGALDSYMRSIALELAPEVRVNSILPGGIRTPMSESTFCDEQSIAKIKEQYPLGFGEVQDIANMVEFLFSDKAKWITGQQFSVDGGASI